MCAAKAASSLLVSSPLIAALEHSSDRVSCPVPHPISRMRDVVLIRACPIGGRSVSADSRGGRGRRRRRFGRRCGGVVGAVLHSQKAPVVSERSHHFTIAPCGKCLFYHRELASGALLLQVSKEFGTPRQELDLPAEVAFWILAESILSIQFLTPA